MSTMGDLLDHILAKEAQDRETSSIDPKDENTFTKDHQNDQDNGHEIGNNADARSNGDEREILTLRVSETSLDRRKEKKMSAARLERKAGFNAWLEKEIRKFEEKSPKKTIADEDDHKLSMAALANRGAAEVISTPREYQLEIFELAKQMNVLAVLDTGSGKTLIACLLIRHMISEELENRKAGGHRRASFFLVDSVNLVFQQSSVLANNLDAKVGRYYGAKCDTEKMWKLETWSKILDDELVIVMTADVLNVCLSRGFILIKDINLICFDEAHHAKKNHAYAKIMRDFYSPEPAKNRPKIFGMTASPIDTNSKTKVDRAASELEELLYCRIYTSEHISFLKRSEFRPQERVMIYEGARKQPFETDLYRQLHDKFGNVSCLQRAFAFAKQASTELGPWCADRSWSFALSERHSQKLARQAERESEEAAGTRDPAERWEKLERDLQMIREAQDYVALHEYGPPKMLEGDVSPKVWLLWRQLQKAYNENPETKCIIFIERRLAARTIYECLKDQVSENFRAGVLLGSRTGADSDGTFTIRQQMVNVHRFKLGILNCLFATSVAEEGLDVPDCNLVIRFDIYNTMIQYVQSRGRARDRSSLYLHMIEKGNLEHSNLIRDVLTFEKTMKSFCKSLPPDRFLDESEPVPEGNTGNELYYNEEETGAKLTHSLAMQFISTYAAHLNTGYGEASSPPIYVVRPAGCGQFTCQLILPEGSPIRVYECKPQRTRALAKRAAAFETVLLLRKQRAINGHFLPPVRRKILPKYANARLAVDTKKRNTYTLRRKPAFWDIKDGTAPTKLWIAIITVEEPHEMFLGDAMQPLCIGTREKLPKMSLFDVYGTRGGNSKVKITRLEEPFELTNAQVELLTTFTNRVFTDVFNKHFEMSYETLRYWFAPVIGYKFDEKPRAADVLDWELIGRVAADRELFLDLTADNLHHIRDRYWVDKLDKSRRFFAHEVIPELNSQDAVPESITGHDYFDSIQDYSYNAGKRKKWGGVKWDIPEKEPVFRAERLLHRLNFLDPPTEKDKSLVYDAVITPSNFMISILPASLVRSAVIFPAVSTRIDAYLHAWELLRRLDADMKLGLDQLELNLALEAITKDSENTNIITVEKRRGIGANYERLEFLGDCYLKLATSISLYCESHSNNEFQLHVQRMILICNQNLFQKAMLIGIPDFIQTLGFSRRTWYPHMRLLHGKKSGLDAVGSRIVSLGDKSVADVCEALIGAALIGLGHDGATKMVTSLLRTEHHNQQSFDQYYQQYKIPDYQLAKPTAIQTKLADDIAEQFGYRFDSPKLLMSAFTHPSNPFTFERVPSYQRLEFLGDALLDLACVDHIFLAHPEANPQWLTEHKMAMVSNRFLGAICVLLGFHKRIRKMSGSLDGAIDKYASTLLEAKERSTKLNFWMDNGIEDPPKILPDVLEAFIGALFVDSKFDYSLVQDFFNNHIRYFFTDMSMYDNFAGQHPTTFLTKKLEVLGCQKWGWDSDQVKTAEYVTNFAAVVVHGKVFAGANADSIKAARVAAAEIALKKLAGLGEVEIAALCSCKEEEPTVEDVEEKLTDEEDGEQEEEEEGESGL